MVGAGGQEGEPTRSDATGSSMLPRFQGSVISATKLIAVAASGHQSPPDSFHRARGAVAGVHLVDHGLNVVPGGGLSDMKFPPDLSVRTSLAEQLEYSAFSRGQRRRRHGSVV